MNTGQTRNSSSARAAPLQGIRVVDFGQYIAGPGAAMTLAELGASVIKVESLHGDQARHIGSYGVSMIKAYNRGKRSIALDLKSDAGREAAWRLIEQSDVLIQNLRPGAMEDLGLGAQAVRKRFPKLIYLSISGFPANSPSRYRPGYDIAAQAESGLMSVTGEPGRLPQKAGVPIVDAVAAQLGAQAVLAALFGRERSGVGASLETSLLEVALHMQAATWCEFLNGGAEPTRRGDGQPNNAPAAEVLPTRDGYIVLSAYTQAHWARFCQLMKKEQLITDPRFLNNEARVLNRKELREELIDCLSHLNSQECVDLLAKNQIVVGAVNSYGQILNQPDLKSSGMVLHVRELEGGSFQAFGLPYQFEERHPHSLQGPPECGQHTYEILQEIGYEIHEIEGMISSVENR